MNQDIRLNIALPDHPKVNRLVKTCGEQAFRCLVRLWIWAAAYEPQGNLSEYSAEEIEGFARWMGHKGKFFEALCNERHRWIDLNAEDENYKYLHDWHEHQPWVIGAKARQEKGQSGGRSRWGDGNKESLTRNQLVKAAKEKGMHTEEEWAEMYHFFKVCVMCGSPVEKLIKGHLVPFAKGGSDSITNVQPLCTKCSSFKGPDETDYRIKYCEDNGLKMPVKWIKGAVVPDEEKAPDEKPKGKKQKDLTEALVLANLMAKGILKHSPKYRTLTDDKKEKTVAQWAVDIDLMIRRDKRNISGMHLIIDWIYNVSDFWYKNILSGYKFRKQYDKLVMDYQSYKEKNQKPRIQRIRQDPDAIKRQIRDMNNTINIAKASMEGLEGDEKLAALQSIRAHEAKVEELEEEYERYA